jgi:hypothetical protein
MDLLLKLPFAIAYLLSPKSARNQHKRDYPRELLWAELKGMLIGPLAYFQRRRRANKIIKQFGPLSLYPNEESFETLRQHIQTVAEPERI